MGTSLFFPSAYTFLKDNATRFIARSKVWELYCS